MQRLERRKRPDFSLVAVRLTVVVPFQSGFLPGPFFGWGGVYRLGLSLYGSVEIAVFGDGRRGKNSRSKSDAGLG